MKLTDYHALRTGLQRNASPAGPEAVAELGARLRSALVDSGLFHTVEIDHTDDIDRLVIGLAQFAPHVDTAQVAWKLERLWHDVLAYTFWSAEAFLVEDGHVELQGSTRSSQQGHYVTLHLIAQQAVAPERPVADVVVPAQGGVRAEAPVAPAVPAQEPDLGQSRPSTTIASATRRP